MEQYIVGKAKVRIHNEPDQEKIKVATERFLKQVQKKKRKVKENE